MDTVDIFLRWLYYLGSKCASYSGCELWSWIDSNYVGAAAINDCYMKKANAANSKRSETGVLSGRKGCK